MSLERWLWPLLIAGLACSAALLARFHGLPPRGTDDQYYYAQARSLLVDGDLDLRNELGSLTPRPENVHTSTEARWDEPTATGLVACKYPIGAPLLQLPFLALGVGIASALGRADGVAPGYETPAYLAWHLGVLFYALLAVACARRFAVRALQLSEGHALLGAIGALLGGPLFFHSVGDPYMAHVHSALLVSAWLAAAAELARGTPISAWRGLGSGALLGLACATRLTNLVYAFALLPLCAPRRSAGLKPMAFLALGVALAFLPQMLAWRTIFGSFLLHSYRGESFDFTSPELYGNFLSARAGLFVWAPLWALGLLAALPRVRQLWSAWIAVLLLAYWGSCWWCWWWGDTYGGRAYSTFYPLVAAGLGLLCARPARRTRLAVLALLLLGACWSVLMIYRVEVTPPESRARGELFGPRAVR
ncbi:MAG: hypothetical protein IPN34_08870 [Planctomycetes bacterium]|nr:hypothetical protein [Planctomycetota bacterium]